MCVCVVLIGGVGQRPFSCISRVTDQNGVSRIFDIFTFLHENVQQSVHFDVMMLILLSDHEFVN